MENLRFKVWDKVNEIYFNHVDIIDFMNGIIICYSANDGEQFEVEFESAVVMQSTGLFDLDGNEIYIGDILKVEDEYTQVVFHEDNTTYGIYLEDKEGGGNPISDYSTRISLSHIKGIIEGNIYEHPNLLEE